MHAWLVNRPESSMQEVYASRVCLAILYVSCDTCIHTVCLLGRPSSAGVWEQWEHDPAMSNRHGHTCLLSTVDSS